MKSERVFRQITFARRLDKRRLRAVFSRIMREVKKNPLPKAAPARVESVLIEPDKTRVSLSGNRPGLDAVAAALRSSFADVKISKDSRADVLRLSGAAKSSRRVR